ncbi:MAG: serine/threonine protein kinase [Gammaproteobacteria bacterium]|nr:serine/threonine protein kinase [Gammaproteobacteria bacterium]
MAKKFPTFETPFETYIPTTILGEGGAGRVYEVTNSLGESLAIKCLSPARITTERLKRFRNEIGFCQRQNHANIVRVVDTGAIILEGTKCPFYVMKRHTGTLRTHMTGLKPEGVMPAFSQILDGVEAAHLSNVWHRDLKPENILWNERDKVLIVADFGIAHFEEEEIFTAIETKAATRMANFQYSAPEQRVRGSKVDHRADIFSLGLILNEMFTGEIAQGAGYKRISEVATAHGYLDDIVESMIQQNPNNRPSSIAEIKKELIGRKNSFIALQQYDATRKQVVSSSALPEFEALSFIGVDYAKGVLSLKLNKNVPPGWTQEFQQPRGGHSGILGYGPEAFQIIGDTVTVSAREDEKFIQDLVNNAKQYLNAANRGYLEQLRDQAVRNERAQRLALEKAIAEAELRKNILLNVKL